MSPTDHAQDEAIGEPIRLVPYRAGWPAAYAAERDRLLSLFPLDLRAVEHIGSTAIPGMSAKPVIDLLAGVDSMAVADNLFDTVLLHGYTTSWAFNATLADRRWFMRSADGHRTHHLHVVVFGSPTWHRHLLFRDRLRADGALARSYARLKSELALRFEHDREAYTDAKSEFVTSVLSDMRSGKASVEVEPSEHTERTSARPLDRADVERVVTRPELLLFDLGGVLVDNVAFERLSATPGIGMSVAEIKSKWLASSTVRSFESGALSPEAFARAFVDEWSLRVEPGVFLADFAGWPKGFYPGALELLAGLRQHARVACLSNSNSLHWQMLGNLAGHFDVALSSHLLEAIKPDALCFERALRACGVDKERVAFFDDSLENVAAARAFGMQAFHACGLAQVNRTLLQNGWFP